LGCSEGLFVGWRFDLGVAAEDRSSYTSPSLDMTDATFACPGLTAFGRRDELRLGALAQQLEPDQAVIACRVDPADDWYRRCEGRRI